MEFSFFVATAISIIGILIAVAGVYYSKNSYLITLKTFEKDKKRTEKAKHYYNTYINKPPSYNSPTFLKKIDADDLNEGVSYPSEYTDFIIKNFPDKYFQFSALLKKSWSYFEIIEVQDIQILQCKIKYFRTLQAWYFFLYFFFAMCFVFLALYSDLLIYKITVSSPWGVIYIICMSTLGLIAFTILALLKTTQISEAKRLNDEFKKILPSSEDSIEVCADKN